FDALRLRGQVGQAQVLAPQRQALCRRRKSDALGTADLLQATRNDSHVAAGAPCCLDQAIAELATRVKPNRDVVAVDLERATDVGGDEPRARLLLTARSRALDSRWIALDADRIALELRCREPREVTAAGADVDDARRGSRHACDGGQQRRKLGALAQTHA